MSHDVRMLKLVSGEEIFAELKSIDKGKGFLVYRPAMLIHKENGKNSIIDWMPFSEQELFFFKYESLLIDPITLSTYMEHDYLLWSNQKSEYNKKRIYEDETKGDDYENELPDNVITLH